MKECAEFLCICHKKSTNRLTDKWYAEKNVVIEPLNFHWASAGVLLRKKDGSMSLCIDYRRLNEVTIEDAYPLPNIEEKI